MSVVSPAALHELSKKGDQMFLKKFHETDKETDSSERFFLLIDPGDGVNYGWVLLRFVTITKPAEKQGYIVEELKSGTQSFPALQGKNNPNKYDSIYITREIRF